MSRKRNPRSPANVTSSSSHNNLPHLTQNPKSPLQSSGKKDESDGSVPKGQSVYGSPPTPAAHPPPPPPARRVPDAIVAKAELIPIDLRACTLHDFKPKVLTRLQLYRLMFHFDPNTKCRPNHSKTSLETAFSTDVAPLIRPFVSAAPPVTPVKMQTDGEDAENDFDPLSRKTTRAMLAEAISKRDPTLNISSSARTDQLLWLYKDVVDPKLPLGDYPEYGNVPRILKGYGVKQLSIEELRHALHVHAPQIFVHTVALTKPCMINMYHRFVSEEPIKSECRLILGYHYTIIPRIDD